MPFCPTATHSGFRYCKGIFPLLVKAGNCEKNWIFYIYFAICKLYASIFKRLTYIEMADYSWICIFVVGTAYGWIMNFFSHLYVFFFHMWKKSLFLKQHADQRSLADLPLFLKAIIRKSILVLQAVLSVSVAIETPRGSLTEYGGLAGGRKTPPGTWIWLQIYLNRFLYLTPQFL